MALRRLSTRLEDVLSAADSLRVESHALVAELGGEVSLGRLFAIQSRAALLIATVCDPYEGDTALGEYADEQFPEAPFQLLERLAGVKQLLQAVAASCAALVAPYTPSDLMTESVVIVDGVGVSAPMFEADDTATLRGYLQMIRDNIPE